MQYDNGQQTTQFFLPIQTNTHKNKNFAVADLVRNKLNELKITLEDRTDQTLSRRG